MADGCLTISRIQISRSILIFRTYLCSPIIVVLLVEKCHSPSVQIEDLNWKPDYCSVNASSISLVWSIMWLIAVLSDQMKCALRSQCASSTQILSLPTESSWLTKEGEMEWLAAVVTVAGWGGDSGVGAREKPLVSRTLIHSSGLVWQSSHSKLYRMRASFVLI